MAIFSLHAKIIGKGQKQNGVTSVRSAVASAAYRAGAVLRSLQEGVNYDYSKKQGIIHSEIMLPVGAPERLQDRQTLWNEVEELETRRDAQYCRELVVALPVELSHEENIRLVRSYIRKAFVEKGMIADFAFHDPDPKSGQRNPHVHIMLTMRGLTLEGQFEATKNRKWNDRDNVQRWRERWARSCNKWMEKGGFVERIDHRSYKEQGVNKAPTVHMGTEATAMERKGIRTVKGDINRNTSAYNAAKECGVDEPDMLKSNERQWQVVRGFRDEATNSRIGMEQLKRADQRREAAGLSRHGIQRRTYTLLRNVVRQGQTPAPPDEAKNALRGDKSTASKQKTMRQLLDEIQRNERKTTPSGEVSRQPAHQSFISRLWVKLRDRKRGAEQQTEERKKPALYDIRVMAGALNILSKDGIGSYRQLEERLEIVRGCLTACEDELSGSRNELSETRRLSGIASAGVRARGEADDLRAKVTRGEQLHRAALRVQANRQYAEEYEKKLLFKDNYYKKYAGKLDEYRIAAAELKAAGFDESTTPEQLRQPVEGLRKQLKQQYQKQMWAEAELKAWGFALNDTPRLQQKIGDLTDAGKLLNQKKEELRNELWKWERVQGTVKGIVEGKPAREEQQPKCEKQKAPDREGRGR